MYEFLIDIVAEEKKKYESDPTFYEREYNNYKTNLGGLPSEPKEMVHFAVVMAIKSLVKMKRTFSPGSPMTITGGVDANDSMLAKYLWTSLMLLGTLLPDKFDQNSIRIYITGFDEKAELGYFTRFSSYSIYETVFKKHLNQEDVFKYILNSSEAAGGKRREEETARREQEEATRKEQEEAKRRALEEAKLREPQEILRREREAAILRQQEEERRRVQEETRQREVKEKIICLSRQLHEHLDTFEVKARTIRNLIHQGADINYQSETDKYTALMIAIDRDNQRIAEYLLKNGANPLLKNRHNETARDLISHDSPLMPILLGVELINFLRLDDLTNLRLLLSKGADINYRWSDEGYTPLLLAVKENRSNVVEFLLSMGADVTVTLHDGRTIFDLTSDEAIGMKVRAMIGAVESECDEEDEDRLTQTSSARAYGGRSTANLTTKVGEKGLVTGGQFFRSSDSSAAGAGIPLSFGS